MSVHALKDGFLLSTPSQVEFTPRFIKSGLLYFDKYENVRKQGIHQKALVIDLLKAQGNDLFKQSQIEVAITKYEQVYSHITQFI